MKRWASLLLTTVVSSCESACCRWVSVWQKLCTQDLYGPTISSFTGNHSVWLSSSGYRCISLDIQELYYLMSFIGFGIGQASFVFGQSLIEVIGQYHLNQARYILGCHSTIGITGWTLSSVVITGWTLSSFADKLLIAIIVQETRLISGEYSTLLDIQVDIFEDSDWWTLLSGRTMFLNISSRVTISSSWTIVMMNQVIIGLLSFILRRSLK